MSLSRSFKTIELETTDKVARLTFATPESLNSITEDRLAELRQAVDLLKQDRDVRTLIISGQGRAFCVGLDLELLKRAFVEIDYFESVVRRLNGILLDIEALPFPTIAAVNGIARAGGFEIALACDLMLIADEARIGDNHTHVGVMPGGGSTQRLPKRIGDQRAKELIWSARWLQGQEAVDYGLALRAMPLGQLSEAATELALNFAEKPGACLAAVKSAMTAGQGLPIADAVEKEIEHFVRYTGSEPYAREGFFASLEGRPPNW